ncbi:MAG: isoprenylcysteine carboxylmethyltransferase family protein [Myxococcales bacterium]|nr:isoprenylcysteine carboxylmethyltransferase family protein [Myxococcales bacterium]
MHRLLPPVLFGLLFVTLVPLRLLHPKDVTPVHAAGAPMGEVGILAVLGLLALVGARMQFARSNAEIMTFHEPRNLVVTGLFRFSRNPMYLGFLLVLVAAALFVNTWCAFAVPLVFWACCQFWYVPFEERAAQAAFGQSYAAYCASVRRWI